MLALALAAALATSGDLVAEAFELPDGLEIGLWAESPQLFNPTCIDVDARGRVWVAEAVNYRKWGGRNPGLTHAQGDRIVVLEDVDGDGRCDSSRIFAQDEELVAPMGIAVLGDRVFVSCSPKLLVYTDTNGDHRADRREVFLEGFGGPDHDHGLHSVVAGPDGRLYFAVGNAGPHVVTDRGGWTLRSGAAYAGGGAQAAANDPGLVSDDGHVWTGGLVLRVGTDGRGLTPLAHNFRNNYEVAVDSFGDLWQSDNDDDGNRCCRTLWVMESGNHGYFSADGARFWTADRRPGQDVETAHWHQDDPGVVPAGTINGAGGPTGVAVYEGDLLPARFRGAVLNADAGRNLVYAHLPRAQGAGFTLEPDLLVAADVNADDGGPRSSGRWFRPSDVAVGLAGEVFIADWYDAGVGGHGMADREAYGRILRIVPKGVRGRAMPEDLDSAEGRARAVDCPAPNVRHEAVRRILDDPVEALQVARRLAGPESDALSRARAAWLLARVGERGAEDLAGLLGDADPRVRVAAFRAIRSVRPEERAVARRLVHDPAPAVRREVAITLRDLRWEDCREDLVALLDGYDGEDRWYLEALGIAAEGKEEQLFQHGLEARPQGFADIAWRLHPASSIDWLEARAREGAIAPERRRQAVDALAFVPTRRAAEAMVGLSQDGPEGVRDLAFWWVRHRSTNDWAEFDVGAELGLGDRDPAAAAFTSDWLSEGSVPVDVDVAGAELLALVVDEGEEGYGWDWADWADARLVGPDGEVPLGELQWIVAEAGWGHTDIDRNCVGGPLLIAGREYERGLGTHAPSLIVYRLPEGRFERFVATAGVDDAGCLQDGARTRLRFRVHVEGGGRAAARLLSRAELLRSVPADGVGREEARTAARELALDPRGAAVLIRMAERGELDEQARAWIAEHVFANPDFGIRAQASAHFERLGAQIELPPVDELVRELGDEEMGREVFFGRQAGCSTCHLFDGEGASIGPDLTRIRDKYGRRQLFEGILNPNADIVMGYESWTFETEDGLVYSGILESDGDTIVLRESSGERHVLEDAEVVFRRRHTTSLMPENVAVGLTVRQLADLAEFLLTADVEEGR